MSFINQGRYLSSCKLNLPAVNFSTSDLKVHDLERLVFQRQLSWILQVTNPGSIEY